MQVKTWSCPYIFVVFSVYRYNAWGRFMENFFVQNSVWGHNEYVKPQPGY